MSNSLNFTILRNYTGLVDQIDALLWMEHDNGSLSQEQLDQLADLRNQIEVYGERADGWVKSCDRALAGKPVSAKYESMIGFYTKFVNSFDCPPVLAEAAVKMFKEVLLESSQSSNVAEHLRQKVGVNPNETQGMGVFGLSGDDNLPQQTTIDNTISDAMISGSFDAIGDDISTADPNGFDETLMGLGSSELDTSGNNLNPDDWGNRGTGTRRRCYERHLEEGNEAETDTEPVVKEGGAGEETNTTNDSGGMETLEL